MQNCKQGNLVNDETGNLKKGKQFELANRKAHCRFKGNPAKREKVQQFSSTNCLTYKRQTG
jgi:hypothetical protein